MIDFSKSSMRASDVATILSEDDLFVAAQGVSNQAVKAQSVYCHKRIEKELVALMANPQIVREGDATQDMVYRTGLVAGLAIAASVCDCADEYVRNRRGK